VSVHVHLRLVRGAPASDPAPEPVAPRSSSRPASLVGLSDAALVVLALQGDNAAAECLYRRHAGFAFGLAARVAGSTADIEDVVHDAFIKAFAGLETLRNPAAFPIWLGSIVVRAVRSRLRRARLMRALGLGRGEPIDIESIASAKASPATRAELAQVYALLQTLAPDDRIAWTLRVVEGHELIDAAALAGCSLATVKRRIRRAQSYIDEHFVGATAGGVAATEEDEP
jgi:RNA polymerase sigma-70 factor (ECF subfamily)